MTDPVSTPDDVLDELQWRWLGREYVAVEALVHEHPRVAEDASAMLDLVYAEVLLREDNGQNAVEAEYVERFPELSERIARQLQLHRALRDSEPGFDAVTVPEAPPLQQQAKSIRQAARNDVQIPGFEIQAVAGRGTCGVVYRARDEELNRIVSIKLLQGIDDPESPQEKTNTTFTHNGWGRVNQPRVHRMIRQAEEGNVLQRDLKDKRGSHDAKRFDTDGNSGLTSGTTADQCDLAGCKNEKSKKTFF